MNLESQIKIALEQEFQPRYLQLENESHLHRTPPNSQTHFKCRE